MSEDYQEVTGVAGAGEGVSPFYHVPQQSRREKLRYPSADEPPPPPPIYQDCPFPTTFTSPPLPPSYLLNSSYCFSTQFDQPMNPFHLDHHHSFGNQGVSLSLSSSFSSHHSLPFDVPMLDHKAAGAGGYGDGLSPMVVSWGVVPAGPFTGSGGVLMGSRFLRPTQQLLEELCDVGLGRGAAAVICVERSCEDGSEALALDLMVEELRECEGIGDEVMEVDDGVDQRRMKNMLISMLDEVYRRYKHYYQQMQAAMTSFESVSDLSIASPYASMALKSMSKHFRSLKNAISDQLRFADKALVKERQNKGDIKRSGLINGILSYERKAQNSGYIRQPVWRPQRGLPECAVSVLKAWLFEHFLHPYPTDTDKQKLAKRTGLSRNQVSNWFINARVRLWKPMVEEIHSLELQQHKISSNADNTHNSTRQPQPPTISATSSNKQPPQNISAQKTEDPPPKRSRHEIAKIPNHIEEPLNLSFDDVSSDHRFGVEVASGGHGDVSLTLGLHQDDGICLSEPLPLSVARRFGLEERNIVYVVSRLEGQDRHFGKGIDCQLLRLLDEEHHLGNQITWKR